LTALKLGRERDDRRIVQIFLAAAIGIFVLAASVVGLRLLVLARRSREVPELLVGCGFSLIGLLGYPLAMGSGFGRGTVAEVHAGAWFAGLLLMNVGLACLWAFTARVFRAERRWALAFAAALTAAGLASAFGMLAALRAAAPEALSFRVAPGWTALGQLSSGCGFAWIGVESWLQLRMARRRRALGLSDPVVANRFLLWVLFSLSTLGMNVANSAALLAGVSSVESVPVQAAMTGLGLGASLSMYLAFLPPAAYRRWLAGAPQAS
jgi:uncharacterized membrane protein